MKNKYQAIKIALLVLIYCFTTYLSADASYYYVSQNSVENNHQKELVSLTTKAQFIDVQQLEYLVTSFTVNSLPNFESSSNSFFAVFNANELLLNSKFKQYQNHLNTILIRHRKSDLIFPFHYFW